MYVNALASAVEESFLSGTIKYEILFTQMSFKAINLLCFCCVIQMSTILSSPTLSVHICDQ